MELTKEKTFRENIWHLRFGEIFPDKDPPDSIIVFAIAYRHTFRNGVALRYEYFPIFHESRHWHRLDQMHLLQIRQSPI